METVTLSVANCPDIDAHLETPAGPTSGGVIVIQEIFGANAHIRDVCRLFAGAGYMAIAPALFDVESPGVELEYNAEAMQRGRELAAAVGFERALQVVQAARDLLEARGVKFIGTVGFCWGGSLAYLSNTRLGLPSVSYYGAKSRPFLNEKLRAPMMFHFGAEDASIPAADIQATKLAQPAAQIFVYEGAGHAFNRDVDNTHFHPASARIARERTFRFFSDVLK